MLSIKQSINKDNRGSHGERSTKLKGNVRKKNDGCVPFRKWSSDACALNENFFNFQNFMSYQLQQIIRKIKAIYLNDKQNNYWISTFKYSKEKFSSLPYFLQHWMSLCQSATIWTGPWAQKAPPWRKRISADKDRKEVKH